MDTVTPASVPSITLGGRFSRLMGFQRAFKFGGSVDVLEFEVRCIFGLDVLLMMIFVVDVDVASKIISPAVRFSRVYVLVSYLEFLFNDFNFCWNAASSKS